MRLGPLDGDESSDVHGGAGRESEVGNLETEDRENQYEGGDHTGSTAWPRPRYGLSEETQVPPSMPEPSEPYRPNEPETAKPSVARLLAIIISAGLAWATAVTVVAWILGRLLSRG